MNIAWIAQVFPRARDLARLACVLVLLGLAAAPLRANDLPSGAEVFQAGVDEAARELGKEPKMRHLSPEQLRARAEFVFGNMLFVTIHELAHALVSEMDLVVLGREEDAADAYATLGALQCGSEFSRRTLVEAAKGWFMTAQRNRQDGDIRPITIAMASTSSAPIRSSA